MAGDGLGWEVWLRTTSCDEYGLALAVEGLVWGDAVVGLLVVGFDLGWAEEGHARKVHFGQLVHGFEYCFSHDGMCVWVERKYGIAMCVDGIGVDYN